METKEELKELNLCELLKGCDGLEIYNPYGYPDKIQFVTKTLIITENNIYKSDGALIKGGRCEIFPTKELHLRYFDDPYTAWMKWQEEQKYHIEVIVNNHDSNGDLTGCAYVSGDIAFRTRADRDKCLKEIQVIIDKYRKEVEK